MLCLLSLGEVKFVLFSPSMLFLLATHGHLAHEPFEQVNWELVKETGQDPWGRSSCPALYKGFSLMEPFGEYSHKIQLFSLCVTFPLMSLSLCLLSSVSGYLSLQTPNGPKIYYSPFCPLVRFFFFMPSEVISSLSFTSG